MNKLLLSLVAALLAIPTSAGFSPSEIPLVVTAAPTDPLLRPDTDGGRTLLLNVEDAPANVGVYTYSPSQKPPPQVPNVKEAGGFTHAWTLADGSPVVAVGVYVISDATSGRLRVPLVLVEGAATTTEFTNSLSSLAAEALQEEANAAPFLYELLVPELQRNFAEAPSLSSTSTYKDYPTLYVWLARRVGVAGESWVGVYLARTGSVTPDANGRVASATKDIEIGTVVRANGVTQRAVGAYLTNTLTAGNVGDDSVQTSRFEVGLAAINTARVPLASLELRDRRTGDDRVEHPRVQQSSASFGVVVNGKYEPLLGIETRVTYRPSDGGFYVNRITSVGVYVSGEYRPVAGFRYHSDRGDMVAIISTTALRGPGVPEAGNWGLDVGAFPADEYVPAAGMVYRSHFREARSTYQAFIGVGPYTPLGFAPLVAVTYDGSLPLVTWATAVVNGDWGGNGWLIAAGTVVLGNYVPLVGVEALGAAPLGERDYRLEFRVGVFAGTYGAFVPVASLAYDGSMAPRDHALAFALKGGPGADAGEFAVRLGAYTPDGQYVGLAGAEFRSEFTGEKAAETMLVLGVYVQNQFIPVAGVAYDSNVPFVTSLRTPGNTRDDETSRFYAGVFVQGQFVPLVTVENNADSVRVWVGP